MCTHLQLTVTSAVFAKLITTIDDVLCAPYPCLNRWVTVSATLNVLIQAGKRAHLALQVHSLVSTITTFTKLLHLVHTTSSLFSKSCAIA
jgi:hypothetical protein